MTITFVGKLLIHVLTMAHVVPNPTSDEKYKNHTDGATVGHFSPHNFKGMVQS